MAIAAKPKLRSRHKKARGAHHRRDKRYLQTYHPFLPLLMLVVVGLAINFIWSKPHAILGASTSLTATQLLQDTNTERRAEYDKSLTLNPQLSSAAQAKANDMVARDYWSHTTPDGKSPWTFVQASGYGYRSAGENLAYGFEDSSTTIRGWMNSPEHRANILNDSFGEVGFGIAVAPHFQGHDDVAVIVALYGQPVGSNHLAQASTGNVLSAVTSYPPLRSVAQVQLLSSGQTSWSVTAISVIGITALGLLLFRNVVIVRKLVTRSEIFIVDHRYVDVAIVSVVLLAFALTRSVGFIH